MYAMKVRVCLIYLTYDKFFMFLFPGDELRGNGGSRLSPIMRYHQVQLSKTSSTQTFKNACFEVLLASTCRL